MATLIDITGKIKNETKFLKYGDKTYKVDDRKNTMMKVYAQIGNENSSVSIETLDKIMELLLGKDALKDFDGFSYEDYLVTFFAAMACVQNKSYEEVEATFRNAQQ